MNPTAEKIVTCATRLIREGGYHAFSFRQIASELGIKSASIHYHFPTKEALGIILTQRYAEDFLGGLGAASSHAKPVDVYITAFQTSFEEHRSACICGILAAESGRLPEPVREALLAFTSENISWLESAIKLQYPEMKSKRVKETAASVFSALEGAITFASMTNHPEHLTTVGKWIRESVGNS